MKLVKNSNISYYAPHNERRRWNLLREKRLEASLKTKKLARPSRNLPYLVSFQQNKSRRMCNMHASKESNSLFKSETREHT